MLLSAFNELTRQRCTSNSDALEDKTKWHIGSRSPTTLRMVEFQLEDVFLVIFILNMDRKPNVVEFFILGHQWQEWHSQGWQDKDGDQITTTTPESRSNLPQEGEKVSIVVKFTWIRNPFVVLRTSQIFFFLAVSRPDSGNCHERDGSVYRQHLTVRTHAHFFSLRTRHMWLHVWLKGLTILCVARKVISSLVMSLLNVPSTPFPPHLLIAYYHTDATDWNQTKPVRDSALGWTVWPIWPIRLQTQTMERPRPTLSGPSGKSALSVLRADWTSDHCHCHCWIARAFAHHQKIATSFHAVGA